VSWHRIRLWGLVVVYMAAIFTVSSLHQPQLPEGISDKPAHALGYVGLAIVVVRALSGGLSNRVRLRNVLVAIAITALYGVTDEVHQLFVPGRSAELLDLAADVEGALIGAVAIWAWSIITTRPQAAREASRHEL
jgi:VanZ family protein